MGPHDTRSRPLRDLRISVTDRCNFRCRYCMPRERFGRDHAFLPRPDLLTYEEIVRLAGVFLRLGVGKIRLTGGEPLVRKDLPELVAALAALDGIEDLCLTTNGALLADFAGDLARAGLHRVTVSLDSVDEAVFAAMTDSGATVAGVRAGIDAAAAAGLGPVKINSVVQRGVNDEGVVDLARAFRHTGHVVRFIEFMDVGTTNGWRLDQVVSGEEILRRIHAEFPVDPLPPRHPGEVARRFRYRDGGGEIGVITSVTRPFCGDCSRARLGPDGRLFLCLFAAAGHDLRALVRSGGDDAALEDAISRLWSARTDRYSEVRAAGTPDLPRVEMSFIGG
jgi:cyclic pyranopterin phosphate synthase